MRKRIYIIIMLFALIVGELFLYVHTTKEKTEEIEVEEDRVVEVSFLAVGDNLIHSPIYRYHKTEDGSYNFDDIFEHTNYLTQNVDLAYINFETICAGEELKLSSYPQFNGPVEMIDGVTKAGFDWLSGASNHSFDRGEKGILKQLDYVRTYHPEVIMTGLHDSWEDANTPQVLTIKGLKVGVLDYTYGMNGYTLPKGKEYLVDLIDREKMKTDMDKLRMISDVQIVSIHWGIEYKLEPDETQKELAQYLSDLGADVIIGTHPHVIQPVTYLTGQEGNQTLVMYSLGNFLSAQDQTNCMLGGMMTWNIAYNQTKHEILIKDVKFLPTVTQIENGYKQYQTYALKDWTDEMAQRHTLYKKGQDVSRQYYIDLVQRVIGDTVDIVYE